MNVWVCGKVIEHRNDATLWNLVGVFSTDGDALALCTSPRHFIGPVELNTPQLDTTVIWPGAYFPRERALH